MGLFGNVVFNMQVWSNITNIKIVDIKVIKKRESEYTQQADYITELRPQKVIKILTI